MSQLKEFLLEVGREYAGRFFTFTFILYIASVAAEVSRQILLENLNSTANLAFGQTFLINELVKEFLARPLLFLPLVGIFVLNAWGVSALYFSFSGQRAGEAINRALKNLHRYVAFVAFAGAVTFLGFAVLSVPAILITNFLADSAPLPATQATGIFIIIILTLLSLPGVYLLVSFSNAPFILLLEGKNIVSSLQESRKRVSQSWWKTALFLAISLLIGGIAHYVLSWIIFSLKLSFLPDLPFRAESMLRIFFYIIPWSISASFYDLALYRWYLKLKPQASISV